MRGKLLPSLPSNHVSWRLSSPHPALSRRERGIHSAANRRSHGRTGHEFSAGERLQAAVSRRDLPAHRAGGGESAGGDRPLGRVGPFPLRRLHGRLGLLGSQGRPGDGGGDPDLDSGDRPRARLRPPLDASRKRHHHGHRRRVGLGCGRRDLHAAGPLHPEARPASLADDLHLSGGRVPGRLLPHPAAPLLRARDARPVPVSRGDGHHRGPRHRREGRLAGQAAAAGHRDRGGLRLLRDDVQGLEGVHRPPVRAGRIGARRPGQDRFFVRRHRVHSRPRVRDGPALVHDPVRGRRALELRPGADHLVHRQPPAGCGGLSGDDPDRQDDGQPDLPRLRPVHGRRGDRDGRHLRHPEVA